MRVHRRVFTNELGHEIYMKITRDNRGVTVTAEGPETDVEHTWTEIEARNLREMLSLDQPNGSVMISKSPE